MVFAVPLLTSRVAPRCTAADGLLLVTVDRRRVIGRRIVPFKAQATDEIVNLLKKHSAATLVCGGISRDMREAVQNHSIAVMENVACSADEIVAALEAGVLRPGLGFDGDPPRVDGTRKTEIGRTEGIDSSEQPEPKYLNCLQCADRKCLRGARCPDLPDAPDSAPAVSSEETQRILEAAADVSLENERQLCRLAELVYFCLGMGYRRVGIAFCIDLHEPAGVLAGVLGRFFEVVPVCCKIGGRTLAQLTRAEQDPDSGSLDSTIACNPLGQARALNRAGTDLNVIVGLCIGDDAVFTRASEAPVTTLFVKDKSLANNPIGAVYSEYHLRESVAPVGLTPPPGQAGHQGVSRKHEEAS